MLPLNHVNSVVLVAKPVSVQPNVWNARILSLLQLMGSARKHVPQDQGGLVQNVCVPSESSI